MALSVHTNKSALAALQQLNATNRQLDTTQTRINTGLKVAGAKDNAAVYAVAQGLRSDIGAYSAVNTSLDRAASIGNVGLAAGESISDLLIQMREKATAASDASIDTFTRRAYDADFKALISQVQVILSNAEFDGANIIDSSSSPGIGFIADADGTRTLTLKTQNLSLGGAILTLAANASLGTQTLAAAAVTTLKTSLDNVNQALANLGSDIKKIEAHNIFVTKLTDSLTSGIGNLVDADLAKESARLQALQVKQQLGVQALSIANSRPQIILSLFQN
ncbi:Flagellin protein FlaA [hydrothermal vent metagenome]|uniref:Flagellin protein FlaA n=1 Tax=hydrothermal vent metagenome TaxID=652676 RepID=A0A3B0RLV4_9ZZZZ